MGLITASGRGVTVSRKSTTICSGKTGVDVAVDVCVIVGVAEIVGVVEIVGDRVMVGVSVIVAVGVRDGVGGTIMNATRVPKMRNKTPNNPKTKPKATERHPFPDRSRRNKK
jgi:hypothetical protein